MQVREVGPDEHETVHALFPSWFGPEVQCSAGAWWPSLGDLRRAELVLVAEHNGSPAGVALAQRSGHIGWLLTDPAHTGPAFDALTEGVLDRCGDCWGRVGNDALRAAYLTATAELYQPDPDDPTLVRRAVR